jgi:hypothetical protein
MLGNIFADEKQSFNSDMTKPNSDKMTDYQLQEKLIEERFKGLPIKRRKLWGEPVDCSSAE